MHHESTELVFSADFGGRDAADAVLPLFRAAKETASRIVIRGFPFAQLSYILRVDGDVHTFGPPSVGNVEINERDNYLSVDIAIRRVDRQRLFEVLEASVRESVGVIASALQVHRGKFIVDLGLLTKAIEDFGSQLRQSDTP